MDNKNYGQFAWENMGQQSQGQMYPQMNAMNPMAQMMNPMESVAEMSHMAPMGQQYSYGPETSYNMAQDWSAHQGGGYRPTTTRYVANAPESTYASPAMQRLHKANQSRNGLNSPIMQHSQGGMGGGEDYYSYAAMPGMGVQGQSPAGKSQYWY